MLKNSCLAENGDNSVEVNSVVGLKNAHFDQEHEYQGEIEEESLCCPNNTQLRNEAETSILLESNFHSLPGKIGGVSSA